MRKTTICVCFLFVIAQQQMQAVPALPDGGKKDLEKLDGSWEIVAMVRNGIECDADTIAAQPVMTVKNGVYTWSDGGRPGKIARIDASARPKTIDYQVTGGEDEGKTELAIYELDGDTFRDCTGVPGSNERPKAFESAPGSGHTLITFKRKK